MTGLRGAADNGVPEQFHLLQRAEGAGSLDARVFFSAVEDIGVNGEFFITHYPPPGHPATKILQARVSIVVISKYCSGLPGRFDETAAEVELEVWQMVEDEKIIGHIGLDKVSRALLVVVQIIRIPYEAHVHIAPLQADRFGESEHDIAELQIVAVGKASDAVVCNLAVNAHAISIDGASVFLEEFDGLGLVVEPHARGFQYIQRRFVDSVKIFLVEYFQLNHF